MDTDQANTTKTTITSPKATCNFHTGVLVVRLSRVPQRDVNNLTIELFRCLNVLSKDHVVDTKAFLLRDSDKINNLHISASIRLLNRFNVIRSIHFYKENCLQETLACEAMSCQAGYSLRKSPFLEAVKTKVVEIAGKVCDTVALQERLEYALGISKRFSTREINQDELQTLMVLLFDAGVRISMMCSFSRVLSSLRQLPR